MRLHVKNVIRGFTLVELLVVVAIVAVIASIVIVSISSSRLKARDSRRIADINQVELALEQYFNVTKQYPAPPYCDLLLNTPALRAYLTVVPSDPLDTISCGNNATYRYEYYRNLVQPTEWLLRVSALELPSSVTNALADDVDGVVGPQVGGGWVGGAAANTCTFTAPATYSCPTINCGNAAADTIYCIRS